MFLFITTSRGLYKYDLKKNILIKIFGNWHKGIFSYPSKGFFGLSFDNNKKQIISVSREKIGRNVSNVKSTDSILHFYDPLNKLILDKIIVNNLHDVHQIFYFNKKIYLTDTGNNRIQIYNLEINKIESFINIGTYRKNLNHVNAINVNENKMLIGLNNGNKENLKNAQVIEIDLNIINDLKSEIDAFEVGKLIDLKNIYHTHDIEKIDNDYLISASENGYLISYKNLSILKKLPIWTRGISTSKEYIFVGKSGVASRKLRHSRYYDGKINVLDKKNFNLIKELNVPNIGQLNDIFYYEGEGRQ